MTRCQVIAKLCRARENPVQATHGHFVNKKSLADFDKLEKELKALTLMLFLCELLRHGIALRCRRMS